MMLQWNSRQIETLYLFYTSVRETSCVFCRQSSISPALSLRASRGSACTRDRGAELRDTVEEPASSACRPRCFGSVYTRLVSKEGLLDGSSGVVRLNRTINKAAPLKCSKEREGGKLKFALICSRWDARGASSLLAGSFCKTLFVWCLSNVKHHRGNSPLHTGDT